MNLPVMPPFAPMEAETAREIPEGPEWQYEPKWDGFRCLLFRDGDEVELQSKAEQTLTRYFPELVEKIRSLKAEKLVLDSEIVVEVDGHLSFDDLLQRIHPAESRVRKLSKERPAKLIVFDMLVDEKGRDLSGETLYVRRKALEEFATKYFDHALLLSACTTDFGEAKGWLRSLGGDLDGIIAKRIDLSYASGERKAMLKIKNLRTADCVVGGFRYGQSTNVVGSLLLGLYDDQGLLHHVGFTSTIPDKEEVTKKLESLIEPPGFTGRAPGGPSRWSRGRNTEWQPLAHKLVVEVQYDHFSAGRFRHGTKLLRWRPDKAPRQCLMSQVEKESKAPLTLLTR
ncbi:MAG TPA: ATP-dependent DNA ligase [Bryobacteraceae bacterium]|nr:ATP-dependent DNA ligase [Bryobacteraceae bacterium]